MYAQKLHVALHTCSAAAFAMSLQELYSCYFEQYAERPRKHFLHAAARAHPLLRLIRNDDVQELVQAAPPSCANDRIPCGKANVLTPFMCALFFRAYRCLEYLITEALDFDFRCTFHWKGAQYSYGYSVHATLVLSQWKVAAVPLLYKYMKLFALRPHPEPHHEPYEFLDMLFRRAMEQRGAELPEDFHFLHMLHLFSLRTPSPQLLDAPAQLSICGETWTIGADPPFLAWKNSANKFALHEADPDSFIRMECVRDVLELPLDREPDYESFALNMPPPYTNNLVIDALLDDSGLLLDEVQYDEPALCFALKLIRDAPHADRIYHIANCKASSVRAIFSMLDTWDESKGVFLPPIPHDCFEKGDAAYLFDKLRLLHVKYQASDANEYYILYMMHYFGLLEGFLEHLFEMHLDSAANCLPLLYLSIRRREPFKAVPGRFYDTRLDRYLTQSEEIPRSPGGRPHRHGQPLDPWGARFKCFEWGAEAWYKQQPRSFPEWMAPVRTPSDFLSAEELQTHELYEELYHHLFFEDYEAAEQFIRGCADLDRTNRYGSLLQNAFMVLNRRAFAFLHSFGRISLGLRNRWGQTLTHTLLETQSLWHLQQLYPQLRHLQSFPGRQPTVELIANL